jgi:hypothetical protein
MRITSAVIVWASKSALEIGVSLASLQNTLPPLAARDARLTPEDEIGRKSIPERISRSYAVGVPQSGDGAAAPVALESGSDEVNS